MPKNSIVTNKTSFDELSELGKIIKLEDGETVIEINGKYYEIYACDENGNIVCSKATHTLLIHRDIE